MDAQGKNLPAMVDKVNAWPQRRAAAELRLQDVADKLGISVKQYHLWESGMLVKGIIERAQKIDAVEAAIANLTLSGGQNPAPLTSHMVSASSRSTRPFRSASIISNALRASRPRRRGGLIFK